MKGISKQISVTWYFSVRDKKATIICNNINKNWNRNLGDTKSEKSVNMFSHYNPLSFSRNQQLLQGSKDILIATFLMYISFDRFFVNIFLTKYGSKE